ncbi:MAG: hypothetical protein QOJ85_1005, partial [Solirubrobacteraceae bacterium]|nr:hypothetical protein [Solirubrobacteraceae bacterium]
MSVYEQRLSPFQDDLFLRAARGDHAFDEPAPAPASPPAPAQHGAARRSRPGLTGARPRHGAATRNAVAGTLVAAAVAAGAVAGLGLIDGGATSRPAAAAVRPATQTPLPATRPPRHAPPHRAARPQPPRRHVAHPAARA